MKEQSANIPPKRALCNSDNERAPGTFWTAEKTKWAKLTVVIISPPSFSHLTATEDMRNSRSFSSITTLWLRDIFMSTLKEEQFKTKVYLFHQVSWCHHVGWFHLWLPWPSLHPCVCWPGYIFGLLGEPVLWWALWPKLDKTSFIKLEPALYWKYKQSFPKHQWMSHTKC